MSSGLLVWPAGNPGPVLSLASDRLFHTEWPWTRWHWTGFLIWEIGRFPDGEIQCKWKGCKEVKGNKSKTVIYKESMQVLFSLAHRVKHQSSCPVQSAPLLILLRSLIIWEVWKGWVGVCVKGKGNHLLKVFGGFLGFMCPLSPSQPWSLFPFPLGIYITVLDFIMSMSSHLYFSQNDIVFTYYEERYSNIA